MNGIIELNLAYKELRHPFPVYFTLSSHWCLDIITAMNSPETPKYTHPNDFSAMHSGIDPAILDIPPSVYFDFYSQLPDRKFEAMVNPDIPVWVTAVDYNDFLNND